jgi:hypothetical protein
MATPTAGPTSNGKGASTAAPIPPLGQGTNDPDQLAGTSATELFGWAWLAAELAAELANWLAPAAEATTGRGTQAHHGFDDARRPEHSAVLLTQISQRLATLLAGDRRQP